MTRPVRSLLIGLFAAAHGSAAAADYFEGRKVYATHCASCHGSAGRSGLPGLPNFALGDSLMRSDADIYRRVASGTGAMPGYRRILSENEIRDVIVFLRSLQQ